MIANAAKKYLILSPVPNHPTRLRPGICIGICLVGADVHPVVWGDEQCVAEGVGLFASEFREVGAGVGVLVMGLSDGRLLCCCQLGADW